MKDLVTSLRVKARIILNLTIIPYLIVFFVLGLGLALSLCGYETAFQRSGAVLVSLAIASLAINNFIAWELELSEALRQNRKNITHENALLALKKHIKEVPNLEKFVEESLDEEGTRPTKLRNEVLKLEKIEFLTAFFGTLIWAFGDLPF